MISRTNPKVFIFYRYLGKLEIDKVREYVTKNKLIPDGIEFEIEEMGVNVGPQTKASEKVIKYFNDQYQLKPQDKALDRHFLPQDVYITSVEHTLPLSTHGFLTAESERNSSNLIENTPQFVARLKEEFPNLKVVLYNTGNFIGGLE